MPFQSLVPLIHCISSHHPTIRILAYNIRHGRGMDDKIDLTRSANLILRLSPDVALLQEIDQRTERAGGVDQIQELGKQTGMHTSFGRFLDYDGGAYGMGVLSKHPIKAAETYELPPGAEPRSALAVRIGLDQLNQDILFVGLHLYRTAAERLAQATTVVERFSDEKIPVILAGDFNSDPDSAVIDLMSQYWAIPSKGDDHLTFPSDQPRVEIDYIIYRPSDGFEAVECRVIDEPLVSDHRPVLLELKLT